MNSPSLYAIIKSWWTNFLSEKKKNNNIKNSIATMDASWCAQSEDPWVVCVWSLNFFFCCLQVGGVWRDNLPLATHSRLSSIRVLTWALSFFFLLFSLHVPFLCSSIHFNFLFIFFPFFSQRLFCKEHNIHLPTDKSEFSIEEATERKSPTRCSLPSIRVKKEEPFKPIWNDKSLISPFWWKFSFLPIFEK